MKLFVFVIGVCFVQTCLCAPTAPNEEESRGIAEDDMKRFEEVLKKIDISQKSRDDFLTSLKRIRTNATKEDYVEVLFDLMSVALQGDELCEKKLDLKRLMEKTSGEESEKEEKSENSTISVTDSDLKEMEDILAKALTPKQLEHAMKILRSTREGSTAAEKQEALTDLIFSAVKSLMMKGCEMPPAAAE